MLPFGASQYPTSCSSIFLQATSSLWLEASTLVASYGTMNWMVESSTTPLDDFRLTPGWRLKIWFSYTGCNKDKDWACFTRSHSLMQATIVNPYFEGQTHSRPIGSEVLQVHILIPFLCQMSPPLRRHEIQFHFLLLILVSIPSRSHRTESGTQTSTHILLNNKAWLSQWGVSHWGNRVAVINWTAHDCVRGANIFGTFPVASTLHSFAYTMLNLCLHLHLLLLLSEIPEGAVLQVTCNLPGNKMPLMEPLTFKA